MPITRTAMIDDDGSGTTGTILNNAWKQELYNQIDALATISVAWTPGATGIGPVGTGIFVQIGKLIYVSASITWPNNANPNPAVFSLPAPGSGMHGGLYQGYGAVPQRFWISDLAGTVGCQVLNPATGAMRTNQEMSNQLFTVHGIYFAL